MFSPLRRLWRAAISAVAQAALPAVSQLAKLRAVHCERRVRIQNRPPTLARV